MGKPPSWQEWFESLEEFQRSRETESTSLPASALAALWTAGLLILIIGISVVAILVTPKL